MKKIILLSFIFLSSCTLNKVILHHGIHNLETKQANLKINETNKNDIFKKIGPASTASIFDKDTFIYIERKTTSSKLLKLGKKELLVNNVLVLKIDKRGILINKNFYNKNDMNQINFDEKITEINYTRNPALYSFFSSVRQKIEDPLGKKRAQN